MRRSSASLTSSNATRRLILPVTLLLLLIGVIGWRLVIDENTRYSSRKKAVDELAGATVTDIAMRLRLCVSTTWALGSLISQTGAESLLEHPTAFSHIAQTLIELNGGGITNLQLAPNGTVRRIEPMRASDAKAIGHSTMVDPARRPACLATIKGFPALRATVFGPQVSLQGDIGLFARHPVFSQAAPEFLLLPPWTDASGRTHSIDCSTNELARANCRFQGPDYDGNPTYLWGFVNIFMNIGEFLRSTRLVSLSTPENHTEIYGVPGFEYQLLDNKQSASRQGSVFPYGIFAASAGTNSSVRLVDAIERDLIIPELSVSWRLLVKPIDGWPRVSSSFPFDITLAAVFSGVSFITLIGLLLHKIRSAHLQALLVHITAQELRLVTTARDTRSALVRSVMHDLRSPIVAIGIAAAQLRNALPGVPPPEHLPRLVETLTVCSKFAEDLLSDMLDWERIQAGMLKLVAQSFTPSQLLAGSRATFAHVAAAKGIQLEITFQRPADDDVPPESAAAGEEAMLTGDVRRVQQCVSNLASNAIKFSPAGSTVHVTLSLHSASADETEWVLRTEDEEEAEAETATQAQAQAQAQAQPQPSAHEADIEAGLPQLQPQPQPQQTQQVCVLLLRVADHGSGLSAASLLAVRKALGDPRAAETPPLPQVPAPEPQTGMRRRALFQRMASVCRARPGKGSRVESAQLEEGQPPAAGGGPTEQTAAFNQFGAGKLQGNSATGLGLLITRQIVQLHRGTVTVDSEGLSLGTTVLLRLPMRCGGAGQGAEGGGDGVAADSALPRQAWPGAAAVIAKGNAEAEAQAKVRAGARAATMSSGDSGSSEEQTERSSEEQAQGPYSVLHVEDDPFLRFTLPLQVFAPLRVELTQAADGVEGLEAFTARIVEGRSFDAVVVDNQMPRMSGMELALQLRSVGYTGLIVGLTGDMPGDSSRLAFESACDECLDKTQVGLGQLALILREHRSGLRPRQGATE